MTPNGYTPLSVMLTDACVSTRITRESMEFSPSISKGVVTEDKKLMETKVDRKWSHDTEQMQTSLGHAHRCLCQHNPCTCDYGIFPFNQERGGYRGKHIENSKSWRQHSSVSSSSVSTTTTTLEEPTPAKKVKKRKKIDGGGLVFSVTFCVLGSRKNEVTVA